MLYEHNALDHGEADDNRSLQVDAVGEIVSQSLAVAVSLKVITPVLAFIVLLCYFCIGPVHPDSVCNPFQLSQK